jgi:hypothetical protein
MLGVVISLTAVAAAVELGGGFYEFSVVDPYWPKRFDLVQPQHGGINRKYFWIPAHVVFEVLLLASLALYWSKPDVRVWLLIAIASHAAMRIWSAFDFIPKALAFEKAEQTEAMVASAQSWVARSKFRFPLDVISCGSVMLALWAATRVAV